MLYDNMGFHDNVEALFRYLIKEKYNIRYQIVCSTVEYKKYHDLPTDNVKFISTIRGFFYYFKVGYVFYCTGKIPIVPGINQEVVQMWHGVPLKAPDESFIKGYLNKPTYFTHVYSPSKYLIDLYSKVFYFPKEKIIVTGQPRNDSLFQKDIHYNIGKYKKLIVWTPTFRQSKIMGYDNSNLKNLVPLLTPDEYIEFNDYLAKRDVIVFAKLHPLQSVESKDLISLSNFILMSQAEFSRKGFDLYTFLSQADAMISDYSSIFFDFMLCDKPIAFTENDMKEYTEMRGFAFQNVEDFKAGDKLLSKDDLYKFVDDIANGVDRYADERNKANDLINDYKDSNSSKRCLEAIGISLN